MREADLERHLVNEAQNDLTTRTPAGLAMDKFPLEDILQALKAAGIIPE